MPNYNVRIRDQIDASIPRKIRNIRDSAGGAAVSVRELRTQLRLVGRSSGSSLAGLQKSNDGVRRSAVGLKIAQNNLAISSNRLTVSENSLVQKGQQLEAVNNRVAASALANQRAFDVTAISSTKLSASEQAAALAANKLAVSNNRVRSSNLAVQLSEERLVRAKAENSLASVREAREADRHQISLNKEERAVEANKRSRRAARRSRERHRQSIERERRAEEKHQISLDRETRAKERNVRSTRNQTRANRTLTASALNVLRTLRLLAGVTTIVFALQGLTTVLDAYQNVENVIRNVTSSQTELNGTVEEIFDIANRARVPVGDLTKAFQRFDLSIQAIGGRRSDTIATTETISKLLTLQGATTEEASAALLQLSQAFNKGKLDGDEFRSVMELMPRLMTEVAETMGVTRGELFDLSQEGEITTSVLIKSIRNLRDSVNEDFGNIELTVGQGLTVALNKATLFFGRLSQSTGISRALAQSLIGIADLLPQITTGAVALGGAFTVIFGSSMLGNIGKIRTAIATLNAVVLLNPYVAVAAAIAGIVAAVSLWRNEIVVFQDGTTLGDLFTATLRRIGFWLGVIQEAFISLTETQLFKDTASFIRTGVNSELRRLLTLGNAILQFFKFSTTAAISLGVAISNAVGTFFNETQGQTALERVSSLLVLIKDLFIATFAEIGIQISALIARAINLAIDQLNSVELATLSPFDNPNNTFNPFNFEKFDIDKLISDSRDLLPVSELGESVGNSFLAGIVDTFEDDPLGQLGQIIQGQFNVIAEDARAINQARIDEGLAASALRVTNALGEVSEAGQNAIVTLSRTGVLDNSQQQELISQTRATANEILRIEQIKNADLRRLEFETSEVIRRDRELTNSIVEGTINRNSEAINQYALSIRALVNTYSQSQEPSAGFVSSLNSIFEQVSRLTGFDDVNLGELFADSDQIRNDLTNNVINPIKEIALQDEILTRSTRQNGTQRDQSYMSNQDNLESILELTREQIMLNEESLQTSFDGVAQSLDNGRQGADEYFSTLSEGYTNLITQAGQFDMAVQQSAASAAQGLGKALGGDKEGIGQFLSSGLAAIFQARNSNFLNGLASAGAGRGLASRDGSQEDSQRLQLVGRAATEAQPAVQQLNNLLSFTNQITSSIQPVPNLIGPNVTQGVNSARTALTGLSTTARTVQTSVAELSQPFSSATSAASAFGSAGSSSLGSVTGASNTTNSSVNQLPSAFRSSESSVRSFASTAVSELNKVADAANEAADAQNRVGGGGGGGFFGGLLGFSSGGLVPGGEKIIRVNENGREFVMNNRATNEYLPILEAMNAGRFNASSPTPTPSVRSSSSSGGGSMSVVINNNAPGVTVREQQIGPGEVAIMIEQASEETYNRVASDFNDPNSAVARNFGQNYNAKRVY